MKNDTKTFINTATGQIVQASDAFIKDLNTKTMIKEASLAWKKTGLWKYHNEDK